MKSKSSKSSPTPEAKALSLFLMAYKTKDLSYKEHAKRINRMWDQVKYGELRKEDYQEEVVKALTSYGGYDAVVEKNSEILYREDWRMEVKR